MGDNTPTPVEVPRGHPVAAPLKEDISGISVTKLHVPLAVMLTVLTFMAGGIGSVTLLWWKTQSHVTDRAIHLDQDATVVGGGVAYKQDVSRVSNDLDRRLQDQHKRTRKLLRAMSITCKKTSEGLACRTEVPEED